MKTAYLFPGQASQFVGMGLDLYETHPIAKAFYDRANSLLPFDLIKVSFEGPAEELTQTRITQPAIFVHSVVVAQIIDPRGIHMNATAGHSLGEYSALVAAGSLSFDDALNIVALRGELMQNAGDERPGTMAAVIGLDADKVIEICGNASSNGEVVVAANLNAPGQIAISGDVAAVERAMELAKANGAKRALKLNVSGAFHSPLMEPAAEKLAEKLRSVSFRPPNVPIYQNVTAEPTQDTTALLDGLIKQLTHPVRWIETIQNMAANDIQKFIEVGPGVVLQGLVKRIESTANLTSVGNVEQIKEFRSVIA